MENLIKKVEAFRTHVRIEVAVDYLLFFIFAVNSILVFDLKKSIGFNFYHGYVVLLMMFLTIFYYKKRTNLPLPKDITKKSMEDYQRKQLERFLRAVNSITWWFLLPLGQAMFGVFVLNSIEGQLSMVSVGVCIGILIWAFFQSKYSYNKYIIQYVELGGKRTDFW